MAFDSSTVKWSDMEIFLNANRVVKITGLKYKSKSEMEAIYGAGNKVLDIQEGNESIEGTMTVYKSVVDAMNKAAKAAGFSNLKNVPWTIVCSYKETLADPRQTDTIPGVRFYEYEKGMEQNAKSMPIPMPFMALDLLEA